MAAQLTAHEHWLYGVFSDTFAFEIPSYQRPYSWEQDHALELFDDVHGVLKTANEGIPIGELEPYFLGSIVVIKKEGEARAEVIDGQQRLTTLTILLALLRDHAGSENFAGSLQGRIYQKADDVTGWPARYRLRLRERDSDFFLHFIQEEGATNLLDDLSKADTDSRRCIRENALALRERVKALTSNARQRLAQFLLQRCMLVVVAADDAKHAYRIFSILNSRGLDLSSTDILKPEVLARVPKAQEGKYTDTWESLEEELGRERFEELFGHLRMVFARRKQQETLAKEFRDFVFTRAHGAAFVDEVLKPYAELFAQVSGGELATKHNSAGLQLRALRRLDNTDWMPPCLAFLRRRGADGSNVPAFLTGLEQLAYALFLRRATPTERILRYAPVLQSIEDDEDVLGITSPLRLDARERQEACQALEGPVYETKRLRLPVLLKIEDILNASNGGATITSTVTVEHILPQNPSLGSQWLELFPDPTERNMLVHHLGNLALLPFYKNAAAGNQAFASKKEHYFFKKGATPFALTNELLNTGEWSPAALRARQKRLVSELTSAWGLD